MTTIGDRLKALRDLSGLSTAKLGSLAGLSSGYIGHVERGFRDPKARPLGAVARVLGCSLDWLCTGEGEPPTAEQVQAAVASARERRSAAEVRHG